MGARAWQVAWPRHFGEARVAGLDEVLKGFREHERVLARDRTRRDMPAGAQREISYSAFAPFFVLPTLLVVVPRCPAHLRGYVFGGVISAFGSFSYYNWFASP